MLFVPLRYISVKIYWLLFLINRKIRFALYCASGFLLFTVIRCKENGNFKMKLPFCCFISETYFSQLCRRRYVLPRFPQAVT